MICMWVRGEPADVSIHAVMLFVPGCIVYVWLLNVTWAAWYAVSFSVNVSITMYVTVAVFSMVMSMVRFSPGRVRNDVGKLVTVRGSSICMSMVLVVHMYVAAAAVPSNAPTKMKSTIDTS